MKLTEKNRLWLIPLLLLIGSSTFALFNYYAFIQLKQREKHAVWHQQAEVLAAAATTGMSHWVTALERLAWRYNHLGDDHFLQLESALYIRDINALKALSTIALDAPYTEAVIDKKEGHHDHIGVTPASMIEMTRSMSNTPHPLRLALENNDLLVAAKIAPPNHPPKLLVGRFELQKALTQWISVSSQFNDRFQLTIDGAHLVKPTQQRNAKHATKEGLYFQQPVGFRDLEFLITVIPPKDLLNETLPLSSLILIIGLAMGIGLSGTAYFYNVQRLTQKRLLAIQQSTGSGLISSNLEGVIVSANPAAETMFGYSTGEMIGITIESLVPKRLLSQHQAWRKKLQSERIERGMGRGILRAVDKQGKEFPVSIRISYFRSEAGTQVLSSITDMSAQEALEHDLRASNEALLQANQRLEDFTHIASHDLQEPLRTINNYVGFLKEDIAENKFDLVASDIQFISEATERQRDMISSLLLYSGAQQHVLNCEVLNLNQCIHAVKKQLELLIQDSHATLSIPEPLPNVWGDQHLFVRLFQNLIHNAIKYQPPKNQPHITLTASASLLGDHFCRICVEDNGIGIQRGQRQTIFKPFTRLHGVGNTYHGSGIGLATVQHIVNRHGGAICADAAPNGGSRFYIDLPLGPPPSKCPAP